FRRVRPSIHINGALGVHPHDRRVPGNDLLTERINIRPDAHTAWSTYSIVSRMRLALMLGYQPFCCVPRIGLFASPVINGQSSVISDIWTGPPLWSVLMNLLTPFARQIHLCEGRYDQESPKRQNQYVLSNNSIHMAIKT